MSGETRYADWIAVDWGASRIRAWAMRGREAVAGTETAAMDLDREGFEEALVNLLDPWLGKEPTEVFVGGLGTARFDLAARDAPVPAKPLAAGLALATTSDPRLAVRVIPGLQQSSPADVMHGDTTRIAGVLAAEPDFDGVICLAGAHSRWARVSAGEVVSFRSFMTVELLELLAAGSALRGSIGDGWDEGAFVAAVSDAMSRPEALAARLFSIRAEALIDGLSGDAARAQLTGYLIGAELAAARPYWLGQKVLVVGPQPYLDAYMSALSAQGAAPIAGDETASILAGLSAAYETEKEPMP